MKPRLIAQSCDIAADPFRERRDGLMRMRAQVLGGQFEFTTESPQLMRLARWAYEGLPSHRLSACPPRMTVRLVLSDRAHPDSALGTGGVRARREPAALAMHSGPELLCGASPASTMAVICAPQRTALVVIARELLRFPYHLRYELIELAVFTLAARVQGLVPLHAACVGQGSRGLLLIGDSGTGKSTAVLHCALRGLALVSEDSLFVAPDTLAATGVANFLHVRRDSLRFLAAADAELIRKAPVIRRRSGVRKFEVDLRQAWFHLAPRPLRIAGLVILSRRDARGTRLLEPIEPGAAIAALERSQPYAVGRSEWRRFAERMRRVPAHELRRGRHPRESAAALSELLCGRRRARD